MEERTAPNSESNELSINTLSAVLISIALFLGVFIGVVGIVFIQNVTGSTPNTRYSGNALSVPEIDDVDLLDEEYIQTVLTYLSEDYIRDPAEVASTEQFTYSAVKGIIAALNDPYTNYLTPEETSSYYENRSPDFEGIGVTLAYDGEYTYIESVFSGFPASSAGVLSGDIVLEVDGEDMQGKQPADVASLVRGEKGTNVELTFARNSDGNVEEVTVSITRDTIDIDNVLWKDLGDGIVEITIIQFSDESLESFIASWDKVVAEITKEVGTPKGIVVDLRGNPGGFVEGVKHVLEEFLPANSIMLGERRKDIEDVFFRDNREGAFENSKISVVVNEGSASASEIFATAISENGRGEIVGMPTVGKGVEQQLIPFSDGSLLFIVFQEWLTPDGNVISKENPVQPDYQIDITSEQISDGEDPQIEKALEVLREKF